MADLNEDLEVEESSMENEPLDDHIPLKDEFSSDLSEINLN